MSEAVKAYKHMRQSNERGKKQSLNEAANLANKIGDLTEPEMREIVQDRRQEAKDKGENVGIQNASAGERAEFLEYAISLMERYPNLEPYRLILKLRIMGCSHAQIALWMRKNGAGNITPHDVKEKEKDALNHAKDVVARVRQTGIPIFGGKEKKEPLILRP